MSRYTKNKTVRSRRQQRRIAAIKLYGTIEVLLAIATAVLWLATFTVDANATTPGYSDVITPMVFFAAVGATCSTLFFAAITIYEINN